MSRLLSAAVCPPSSVLQPRLLTVALALALSGAGITVHAEVAEPTELDQDSGPFLNENRYGLNVLGGVTVFDSTTSLLNGVSTDEIYIAGNVGESGGQISDVGFSNRSGMTIKSLRLGATGSISGKTAIFSFGTITELSNAGTIRSVGGQGIQNYSPILTLKNLQGGVIEATDGYAIDNRSTIGMLSNAGKISAPRSSSNGAIVSAIQNTGLISEIHNTGEISSAVWTINNNGTIKTIDNAGVISGDTYAIVNNGTINDIHNSGKILGWIASHSTTGITISGASSGWGLISGVNGVGNINHQSADLVFSTGNTILDSHVTTGAYTVRNQAATLRIDSNIKIWGNYEQKKDATLMFGVSDQAGPTGSFYDTGYGRIDVNGSTTLEQGTSLKLAALSQYAFAKGQRFVVMSTAGDAVYNEKDLKLSAVNYTGKVSGDAVWDNDQSRWLLVLTLAEGTQGGNEVTVPGAATPSTGATTSNATASLGGLFRYQGTNQDLLNVFNPAAALGDTEAANRAGAQLAPSAVKSAASKGAQAATSQTLDIANSRLDTMRSMPQGNSGVSTGERDLQPGVWGQYFGGRARQGERGDVAGYHARFGGMLVGADAQVSDNWRAGGMFSYAHTNVTNDQDNDGSSAKVDAYGLTAYAGYDGRPWYVNMMTGVVRQRYKSERDISYTGFSGNASGKYDGTQYVASVLAGYPIALGQRTTLTPLAGLSYSHLHQEGYTESGGNGAGLKVGSTSADSVKSDLGLKLEHVFDTSYGALTPNMQLRWRHEFVDSRVRTAASFAADPTGSTSFTSLGATPIKDTGVLVLGATLATHKNLTIGLNYTLEAASGYTSQTGDLRVRYAF